MLLAGELTRAGRVAAGLVNFLPQVFLLFLQVFNLGDGLGHVLGPAKTGLLLGALNRVAQLGKSAAGFLLGERRAAGCLTLFVRVLGLSAARHSVARGLHFAVNRVAGLRGASGPAQIARFGPTAALGLVRHALQVFA